MRRTRTTAMSVLVTIGLVGGCAGSPDAVAPPSAEQAAPDDVAVPTTAAEALAAVAALDLPEDERIALLAERAVAEGGSLTVYATGQPAVNEAWAEGFMTEFPGLTVGIVNLDEDVLVQRLVAEAAAGRSLADAIRSTRPGMVALQKEGLLVEHLGVVVPDDHPDAYASPHDVVISTAPFVIPRLATGTGDDGPTEWDDFLEPEHAGCVFAGSPTWTATLVAERGEEGAAAWFEGFLANGGQMAEGSASVLRKLGSGEVDCSVMAQASTIERVILEDGIPLEWTLPSWTAATTHGVAVHRDTPRPHAAALFALWVAGPGGGQISADQGELPINPRVTIRSERLAPWLDPSSPESTATIVLDLEETAEYEAIAFELLDRYFTPNLIAE